MRVVSLEPFLTELVCVLGQSGSIVGVSGRCNFDEEIGRTLPRLTEEGLNGGSKAELVLQEYLAKEPVDLALLKELSPDIVLTTVNSEVVIPDKSGKPDIVGTEGAVTLAALTDRLRKFLENDRVKIVHQNPLRLEEIYQSCEEVGTALGCAAQGRDRASRMKAQFMDWGDNFYDRTKNKKVTFLSSIEPLKLGGRWIPDLIGTTSAISQERFAGDEDREVSWKEVVDFRPDVIIVAPQGCALEVSVKYFEKLQKLPGWDEIPAVVRGEVIFCDGVNNFYRPTPRLISSMAILVSAVAGFESGYITPRDSFYRLRWLELHRHRL